MSKKIKIILIFILVVLLAGGGSYYYFYIYSSAEAKLERLKKEKPELQEYVDDVFKGINKLNEDKQRVESYSTLGLYWKSLADRSQKPEHYREALKIYQQAIDLTLHKNTLFMVNAGHMAEYLKDYNLAESYYKEAISVAPGDAVPYYDLVNLYRWKMKKSPEEIIAVLDEGISRMVNPKPLQALKDEYLEQIGQK